MKHCLITGVTGLIGSALLRQISDNWHIYSITRKTEYGIFGKKGNINSIVLDLSQKWNDDLLPSNMDAVIHLAQSEHFRDFPEFSEDIFNVNTLSTLRLLEYARKAGAKTFIYASSGGIYGHGDEGFKEDEPISSKDKLGFYLGTKLCSEVLAENYTSYMNVIILRFFFVYGPGQRSDMLIPRLVKSIQKEQPIILHGRDGIRVNPIYVTDASQAISRALLLTSSQKINVGGPEVLTMRQIGEMIGKVTGKKPVYNVHEDIQPGHLTGDISKMSRLLGAPAVRFEEGIKNLLSGANND